MPASSLRLLTLGLCAVTAAPVLAAKPPAQYWMSVSTENMSLPGMEAAPGGGLEGMLGGMMMKGMGVGGGRSLYLDLLGPDTPPSPAAEHRIPPGMKMGASLPLRHESLPGSAPVDDAKREDIKILLYWGCGDKVRMGQPRVLDTARMSPDEYASVLVARGGGSGSRYRLSPRKGWTYGEWPNRDDRQSVPNDGSLVGEHWITGNYTPDIKFSLDEKHDFMAPVVFTKAEGGLADAVKLEWKPIPTAIGYFMMAVGGSDQRKEVVIWTSSELQDLGGGLMTWLPNATVQKYIQQKVVMKPSTTTCTIPKGIFARSEGAAVQFIAYGDEANFAYPPKPADPKAKWEPIWTAKVRLKSMGMLPLGTEGGAAAQAPAAEQPRQESTPQGGGVVDSAVEGVKKLKGLFGF